MKLETILKAAVNSMVHGHHEPHCFSAHVQGKGYVNKVHERADYLKQLERQAAREIEDMGFAGDYSEPGYDKPSKGILFADWNCFPRELDNILKKLGYSVEWFDEWTNCGDCNNAVRTCENSYSWRASYILLNDCEVICSSCIQNDLDSYEEHLLNHSSRADTFDVDWSERGFIKFNQDHYENGFHPGQNDKPKEIVKRLPKNHDYLFTIPSVGQFDISFDCWIRPRETD